MGATFISMRPKNGMWEGCVKTVFERSTEICYLYSLFLGL